MHCGGVIARRVWLFILIAIVAANYANARETLHVEGAWRHPLVDLEFPERVDGFSRIEITAFAKDYSDTSVGYIVRKPEGKITITLFVYTNGSEAPKTARDLDQHFENMRAQIGLAFGGAVRATQAPASDWPGWRVAAAEVTPSDAPPFRSLLLLKTCGKWYMKARASYSIETAGQFGSEGRNVVSLINCPSGT